MKTSKLEEMFKGWFVGDFEPTIIKTGSVEVAVKNYIKGDFEDEHYHKIATEITVVVSGKVKMNNIVYNKGDIVVMEPGEKTDFKALADTVCTVVKIPGVSNDKYLK
jgi:quercetin dioxygenase-like cupin family protein